MKKGKLRFLSGITAFALCFLLLGQTNADTTSAFNDVPEGASYAQAVEALADLGIFAGDGSGNFNPNNTVTRAEVATVACKLLGVVDEVVNPMESRFTDVPANHWGIGFIEKAAELGVVSGYGGGKFGPDDPVTKEQVVTILVNAWGYGWMAEELGVWPNSFVQVARNLGIIGPSEAVTSDGACRSLVAEWVYRILYIDTYVEG